jgi:CheY-like chemotaxis protein
VDATQPASALRIVYAEDDELVRETIANLFTLGGAEVKVCVNGAEAVLLCLSGWPDVALLDLTMLGMDGFDGAARIRGNDASGKIRIVALTGHTDDRYKKQAWAAGFDEFLTKPITGAVVEDALRRWQKTS